MKLKTKYILFIALIHLTTLVLSFFIFKNYKWLFIASEALVLLSLFFSYQLYKSLVHPIQLISTGIDAIHDRDFNVKFQPAGQHEMDKLIGIYNQMIDQLREERTLQAEQHFFLEKLIQTSPTAIIILDFDQNIASCNPKALQLLALEEKKMIKNKLANIKTPLAQALAQLKDDKTKTIYIDGMHTFKCHKTHFIDRGFPHYFLLIEELTAEKLHIEKQAYGKVIRMMAHEVNNSIGPINSILQSLQNYESHLPAEEQSEYLEVLNIAYNRNLQLNQFMRNFADVVRLPPPHYQSVDIRNIIKDAHTLMSYQTGEKEIDIELRLPDTPVVLPLDTQQIEQVLINVIKNSIEAIPKTGHIIIKLSDNPFRLEIEDNGIGIPLNKAAQLFSPFFSTKPGGQGVGLTLTREILLNHGFRFSLGTNEKKQTVFRIEL